MRSSAANPIVKPLGIAVGCLAAAMVLVALSPAARARIGMDCPASTVCPTPTPVAAFVSLSVTVGGPNTAITVSGGSFLPAEAMSIYWDTTSKVLGSATTDGSGNFVNVHVKPFAGEAPGLHHICASVNPYPCAQFELQGAPSPTPTPPASPSPSSTASGSPSPSGSPTPTPIPISAGSSNGLDVMLRPPFVFLPIIAALAVLAAIAYWLLSAAARRPRTLPSASIVHRSVRPDFGAPGTGGPEPPPSTSPPPSADTAWPTLGPVVVPPEPPAQPGTPPIAQPEPPAAEPEPPAPPPSPPSVQDEPPDLPQPEDY